MVTSSDLALALYIILPLFAFFIGYFIAQWIIIPRIQVKFYANQGAYVEYSILPTFFNKKSNELVRYGDSSFREKIFAKMHPQIRFTAFNLGKLVIVRLIDPALIKGFYNNQDYYKKFYMSSGFTDIMRNGLLLSEGTVWKRHRKIISSIFHFEYVKSLIPTMTNVAREFFDRLENGSLDDVDIMTHFQYITGDVVGRSFFGEALSLYQIEGQSLTSFMANVLADISLSSRTGWRFILGPFFNMLPKIRKLSSKAQKLRNICKLIIEERKKIRNDKRKKGIPFNKITQKSDLLDLLLDTQDSNDEYKFTDDDIVDEFITFYLAGTDTTGHTVAILVYLLTQYPDVYEKIEEENKNIYISNLNKEGYASMDILNKLEYFQALFKETLRYLTPVNEIFWRVAMKDHELEDLKIKKGTLININLIALNYNPKSFEDPEKFNPDRWLNGRTKNLDPYAFIPFSSGPRNCIGQHMAQVESKIIISEFISRYKIKLADENYKLKMMNRLLYEPLDQVRLLLQKKMDRSKKLD